MWKSMYVSDRTHVETAMGLKNHLKIFKGNFLRFFLIINTKEFAEESWFIIL